MAESQIMSIAQNDRRYTGAGSCATFMFFVDKKLYVGNVGDSRIIASTNNGKDAFDLTKDHKPSDPIEKERILSSGGQVKKSQNDQSKNSSQNDTSPLRLYPGGLSVARAFGDYTVKTPECGGKVGVLISDPEIFFYDLDKEPWDFIFMACDGVYDVF